MTDDWRPMNEKPEGVIDVLARYYDASLNSFLIQRFCQCIVNESQIIWASPFPGHDHTVDLVNAGFRPIFWMPVPELPEHMRSLLNGPNDPPSASPINPEEEKPANG